MSGSADNQILIYFKRTPASDPITGESTTDLSTSDSSSDKALMDGFAAGKFSEAENFTFSLKLADDEGGDKGGDDRSFARWRGLSDTSKKPSPPFYAEPDEISFTRMVDSSSPLLLQYCFEEKPFDSVVMVKRTRMSATGVHTVILRMEFKRVYIVAIEWEDGDCVMETCKFKFMSVDAKYIKRKVDGSYDSPWPCSWSAE